MQRGPSACSHEHLAARSPDWLRVPAMCDRYICSDDCRVCRPGDCVHRVQHAHNAHERDRAGASVRLGRCSRAFHAEPFVPRGPRCCRCCRSQLRYLPSPALVAPRFAATQPQTRPRPLRPCPRAAHPPFRFLFCCPLQAGVCLASPSDSTLRARSRSTPSTSSMSTPARPHPQQARQPHCPRPRFRFCFCRVAAVICSRAAAPRSVCVSPPRLI